MSFHERLQELAIGFNDLVKGMQDLQDELINENIELRARLEEARLSRREPAPVLEFTPKPNSDIPDGYFKSSNGDLKKFKNKNCAICGNEFLCKSDNGKLCKSCRTNQRMQKTS